VTVEIGDRLYQDSGFASAPNALTMLFPVPGAATRGGSVTYLSFGAGPPSAALLILNRRGVVQPKADLLVFADPGSEDPRTYEVLPHYEEYASRNGLPFLTVQANVGPLYEYILERSVPIPAFTSKGLGRRQCTERWKIRPIHKLLRQALGYERVVAQLAMTCEESWRMRDSPVKYVTNVYPLIDLRLTRDACLDIIREEGLPVPPRSACVFCPLKSMARWKETFEQTPDSFDIAVGLEEAINRRQAAKGRDAIYLTQKRAPLITLREKWIADGQLPEDDRSLGQCESGHCFT
jgi:hypothetical protein